MKSKTPAVPAASFCGVRLRRFAFVLALPAAFAAITLSAAEPESPSPAEILEQLRTFRTMGTVLQVAAHPDDENTQMITYFAKGRHYRAGYLSVTRGDGGQNEIGPEFDSELGVARTQELLAARRIDGGRQFFTRALDFGYSKTVDETLRIWDREKVLGDVVRVIRTFHPDVVVAQFFPGPQPGNHGHHNSSAILAVEAFSLAGDPKAYPEQLADGLTPWQPVRIVQGGGGVNTDGTDPVTGMTFAELSSLSRSRHMTQFGMPNPNGGRGGRGGGRGGPGGGRGGRGGRGGGGAGIDVLAGSPATEDIMDGIDTTWARVPNGADIGRMADAIISNFNTDNPAASVPALLTLRARLAQLPTGDVVVDEKRGDLDRILQACLGLTVESTIPQAEVVAGETMELTQRVTERSSVQVRWTGVRFPANATAPAISPVTLSTGSTVTRQVSVAMPASTRVSQPYWLREIAQPGLFTVPDQDRKLIGRPENPPVFPVEFVFEVGGQTLVVPTEPVQITTNRAGDERDRRIDVISPVTVHFADLVEILRPGTSRSVDIVLTANRADETGMLALDLPAGWSAAPASQPFQLGPVGSTTRLTFTVTSPSRTDSANLGAHVMIAGKRFDTDRTVIDYNHIPLQLLQPRALTKAVSVDLQIRGSRVGYFPGAGDDVAECLSQMGYEVRTLTGADLNPQGLAGLDAVVIGVRAFDEKPDLTENLDGLLAWVQAGGTLIEQYNRFGGTPRVGPYMLDFSGGAPGRRTTDEDAPVTFLAPQSPVLTTPNRISQQDFTGWVQERGTYYPSSWDTDAFTPILSMNDPGEDPLTGSLLVAKYGQGNYVYTGIAFFRQLPKGVPGAYRLFANLLSLGK